MSILKAMIPAILFLISQIPAEFAKEALSNLKQAPQIYSQAQTENALTEKSVGSGKTSIDISSSDGGSL